jgi:hypothetical protein
MSEHSISMSSGLPSTVLPPEPEEFIDRLLAAIGSDDARAAVGDLVAERPRSLFAWAALGDLESSTIGRYAAYRVGYHRGLDALRANGWRGSGYVRWSESTNQGFLRCLKGLATMAEVIGETDEAERCRVFLAQLDPGQSAQA